MPNVGDASLDSLHYEDYAPHVNSMFMAQRNQEAPIEFELTDVKENSPSPLQEQFVLTFRAPLSTPPEQQLFDVTHEKLGNGVMFLVPIGKDANAVTFEAVFNRPRQA